MSITSVRLSDDIDKPLELLANKLDRIWEIRDGSILEQQK